MRRPHLDALLHAILDSHASISDLVFVVGRPLQVESDGELHAVTAHSAIRQLTPFQTEKIALNILGDNQRLLRELLLEGTCDCSYQLGDRARFRVNVFRQRGQFAIVMRRAEAHVPSVESLGLPAVFSEICREKSGLVLVTGAPGAGKTATVSAMLDEINSTQAVHIVTLEDPIEFVHQHKRSTFSQRQFGDDFTDFSTGLRSALRQAPKVILVGEMRDRATMDIALNAAESGHMVISSLHTINAGQALNRILSLYESSEQMQLRLRLMETLRWVVSQRLVPKVRGGRQLVQEIMGSNMRVREAIAHGETEGRSFYDIIETNSGVGWSTFDQSLAKACLEGVISADTAVLYASHKNKLIRILDEGKKRLGQMGEPSLQLRLDGGFPPATSPVPTIRLSS